MCQTLDLHPTRKYESDGGPGVRTIAELLREQSSKPEEDMQSFVDSNIFNWLIAGTDAHAKNYALLLGGGGAVRLAPVYDLASILPYKTVDLQKAKLAMKIGGEYRLRNIGLRHWQKYAADLRLQEGWLIERIRAMAASLPDHAATIQNELETAGLLHGTITRLARRLKARASSCQKLLPDSDLAAG
jgi:serine/threonine-protein kinase HipA